MNQHVFAREKQKQIVVEQKNSLMFITSNNSYLEPYMML